MKRYDKVTRYSIKKYSVGVASVAVAAFVFFAGGEAQAADKNSETPAATAVENATSTTKEISTPAEESATTGSSATENKETETTANEATESSTSSTDTSATENKETTSVPDTSVAETAEGETEEKEASLIPTPTLAEDGKDQGIKNIQYDRYKDLYKNGNLPGKFGLYLTGKDKDGNEVVSTAFGNSLVDKNLKDMNLRFVFQNDDVDTNVLFDILLPNFDDSNPKLVVDPSRIDFDKGVVIKSRLGEDYSKNMTYSNINGEYINLNDYKKKFPNYSTSTALKAVYLQTTTIKANDIFTIDIPMKLKDVDNLSEPLRQSISVWDFREGWNRPYLFPNFVEKDEALPDRKIQVRPTLVYLAPGGVEGGEKWDYSYLNDTIKDEIPKIIDVYRFQRAIGGAERGIDATLVTDEDGKQYYIVKSLDSNLAKYNLTPTDIYFNLLNGTNSGTDEEKEKTSLIKILAKHGHTVNSRGYVNNSYPYSFSNGGAKVYNAPEGYEIEGVADDHIQINPAIITKNSAHIVDPASTDWTIKDVLKQFSDPSVVKNLIKEDDANNWINDDAKLKEMKVSIVDVNTNEEIKEENFAKLKQKAGKYKVTASYIYDYTNKTTDDNYGKQKLEISNTGYVNVVTGKQKVEFKVIDNNDLQNPVTIATSEVLEGKSGEAIDTVSLNAKKEQLVADYVAKGYKFVSNTALPTKFDSTENFVDNVDEVPQVIEIAFVHDTEEKKEYSDAERVITYVGAGERTPKQLVEQVSDVFVKTSKIDKVTKNVIGTPTTSGSYTFEAVEVPEIKGYTADKKQAGAGISTFENPKIEETVTYTKNPDIKISDSKDVIRTITITLPDGTTNKVEQKVTFTRANTQDPVTDVVTNGEWNVEKQTLPAYVPTNYTGFTTKVDGNVGEVEVTPDTADLTTTISYVNTPLVKNEEIPFETKYVEEATLDFGKTTETVQGQVGKKKITTTYKFENGNSVAQDPVEEVVVAPVDRVIKVGTKPKVETSEVAYKTVYEADATLEYGQIKVKTEGVNGVDTTTTTYKLAGDHAVANEPTTVRTIEPTNKVILVGTKPSVVTKELDYKTVYKENTSLEAKERKVVTEGKKGSEVTTTTYEVNTTTGEVTSSVDTKSTDAVDKVIEVGTKEKVETEFKNIPLRYEADNSLEKGQQVVEKEGKAGQKVTTTTYTLNTETGEVSENTTVTVDTNSEERVIKVGTQPKVETSEVAYKTVYEADDTLDFGQRKVKTEGVNGVDTTTTTYKLAGDHAVEDKQETVRTTEPTDKVILVGTKSTISEKELAYKTIYKNSKDLELGETKVEKVGVKGIERTITSYTLNTTTGEVTQSTKVETSDPVDEIVLVGTKVKEEKHTYSYNFVSTTEENLPKEVLELTPKGGEYDATVALVPELPTKLEVETEKGTWKFVGYTPSEVLEFEDVVFVGEWNFVKKAEPITPPRPNKPEKPVTPPQPQKPEKHEDPIIPQPNEQDKKPQNSQEQKQETPKQNAQTSIQKEVKKLPNTTATNNTLGASAVMLTVLAALGLKRRKEDK